MTGFGEVLLLVGSLFTALAAVGVLRFDDVFVRMQALSKATTLGLVLVLVGAALALQDPNDITSLVLAAVVHLITTPVGNNLIARATYWAEGIPHGIDTVDQLAEHRATDPDDASESET
jgi:multicomponent Na+:H+ antiporter subunit G